MNLLPFVSAFLLILSLLSYRCFNNLVETISEERSFLGKVSTYIDIDSKISKKKFAGMKNEKTEKSSAKKSKSKSKAGAYLSHRENENPHPLSKLNIAPLFRDTYEKKEMIFRIALEGIRILYEKTPIYREGMNEKILSWMVEVGKGDATIQSIDEFVQKIPDNMKWLYPFFKGTNSYVIGKKGVPPLSDFFAIDQRKNIKSIHLFYTSKPILQAFLGKNLTEEIEKKEREKWELNHSHRPITKGELESILLKERRISFSDVESITYFSKKPEKNPQLVDVHPKTGLRTKRKFFPPL
ncbi:MAG: hypothetical protein L0207_01255 [Chlamydiae bacterium]|nr:hypothetical protein [Chlamydiota bacterium]